MAAKKKGGLGKGLGALIPDSGAGKLNKEERAGQSSGSILTLDINKVEPDRKQPRKTFDEDSLVDLSESIKQHGIISPILVRKEDDYYRIIAGERRWRAARMADVAEVPVIVAKEGTSDQEARVMSLVENLQREDLNPIDEAKGYKELMEDFGLKQDDVAKEVNKSRTAVANLLRLLKLDERVQQLLIEDNDFRMGHARAILGIEDNDRQYEFAMRVIDEKLTARDVEKEVKRMQQEAAKKPADAPKIDEKLAAVLSEQEEKLKGILGTKVSIRAKDAQKGKIEIEYYSADDLDGLIGRLESLA